MVRELLEDPDCAVTLRRLVTDPITGHLLDYGRKTYASAWADGGETNPANLGPLCTRHHQLKTFGGWDITDSRPDGTCKWRSPDGRTYEVGPALP